jgi:hypothetical protein
MALSAVSFAQRIEYQEAQTRVIEPMQDVYVRPLVADMKIIKKERQTYGPEVYFSHLKFADIINSGKLDEILYQAKVLATYAAAKKEGADVIVGATYFVEHNLDEKGKVSEYGVRITVNGYPAKYENWHMMGEKPEDEKWVTNLIDGQRARSFATDSNKQKTEAVKGR